MPTIKSDFPRLLIMLVALVAFVLVSDPFLRCIAFTVAGASTAAFVLVRLESIAIAFLIVYSSGMGAAHSLNGNYGGVSASAIWIGILVGVAVVASVAKIGWTHD